MEMNARLNAYANVAEMLALGRGDQEAAHRNSLSLHEVLETAEAWFKSPNGDAAAAETLSLGDSVEHAHHGADVSFDEALRVVGDWFKALPDDHSLHETGDETNGMFNAAVGRVIGLALAAVPYEEIGELLGDGSDEVEALRYVKECEEKGSLVFAT